MSSIRKWGILVVGWLVVFAGIVLIPLPGPGILITLGGLAILSLESPWARWLLGRCRKYIRVRWPGLNVHVEQFRNRARAWKERIFRK